MCSLSGWHGPHADPEVLRKHTKIPVVPVLSSLMPQQLWMLLPHTMKCQKSRGCYPFLFVPNVMSMIFDCVHLPSCQKTPRWESGLTALSLTSVPAFQELKKWHRTAIGMRPQAETTENQAWDGNVTIHSHRRESGLISSSNAAWLPHWITHHGDASNEPNYSWENSIRLSDSNSISVILLDFKWEGFSIGVILWSLIHRLSSVVLLCLTGAGR